MSNEITATGAASELILAEVLDPMVIEAAYGASTILPLVKTFDLRGKGTITSEHVKWPELSASDLTDGTAISSNTAVNTTSTSVTADEAGLYVIITDRHLAASMKDMGDYAEQLGRALAKKIETDLAAEFADFTTSVGSSGNALTNTHILSGIYQLEVKALVGRGPLVGALHPVQIDDIRVSIAGLTGTVFGGSGNASSASNPFMAGGSFNLYGVRFYPNLYCAAINTSTDRQGAMWPAGNSILWSVLWPARTEVERHATLRGFDVVVTSCYGDECIDTAGGVKVISTATA